MTKQIVGFFLMAIIIFFSSMSVHAQDNGYTMEEIQKEMHKFPDYKDDIQIDNFEVPITKSFDLSLLFGVKDPSNGKYVGSSLPEFFTARIKKYFLERGVILNFNNNPSSMSDTSKNIGALLLGTRDNLSIILIVNSKKLEGYCGGLIALQEKLDNEKDDKKHEEIQQEIIFGLVDIVASMLYEIIS